MNKKDFQSGLQAILNQIDSMSQVEFEEFIGKYRKPSTPNKGKRNPDGSELSVSEFDEIINRIRESKNREEARTILDNDNRMQLRKNMDALARLLKIIVLKHDKRDDIQNKIIEFIIGSRLRSETIRGLNLKN